MPTIDTVSIPERSSPPCLEVLDKDFGGALSIDELDVFGSFMLGSLWTTERASDFLNRWAMGEARVDLDTRW